MIRTCLLGSVAAFYMTEILLEASPGSCTISVYNAAGVNCDKAGVDLSQHSAIESWERERGVDVRRGCKTVKYECRK